MRSQAGLAVPSLSSSGTDGGGTVVSTPQSGSSSIPTRVWALATIVAFTAGGSIAQAPGPRATSSTNRRAPSRAGPAGSRRPPGRAGRGRRGARACSGVPGRATPSSGGSCTATLATSSGRRPVSPRADRGAVGVADQVHRSAQRLDESRQVVLVLPAQHRLGPWAARVATPVVADDPMGSATGAARRGPRCGGRSIRRARARRSDRHPRTRRRVRTPGSSRPLRRGRARPAIVATCSWSVPQHPPTTRRSIIEPSDAYSAPSSSTSPRSSSVASSSSAWLRRDALARTPCTRPARGRRPRAGRRSASGGRS